MHKNEETYENYVIPKLLLSVVLLNTNEHYMK